MAEMKSACGPKTKDAKKDRRQFFIYMAIKSLSSHFFML